MNKFSKRLILLLQLIFAPMIFENHLFAQTQGQQEEKWAKDIFDRHNKGQDFPKFTGQITIIDSKTYKFDEKILIINTPNEELKYLLEKGIFYPNIITGNYVAEIKTKQELDSISDLQRYLYSITRTDSLIITDFEELKFISKSPKQKRYQFYLWRKGVMNPQICYIELTNENATKDYSVLEFIKDCLVTYFEIGSILI